MIPLSLVADVSLKNVVEYLVHNGWKRDGEFSGENLLVFNGPADDDGYPIQLVVPSSEAFADFRPRVADLVSTICVLEQRSVEAVVESIRAADAEQLRVRLLHDVEVAVPISVSAASTIAHVLQTLLASAACVQWYPRRHYARVTRSAQAHARAWLVRVSATAGETIVTEYRSAQVDTSAFARAILSRIMRGFGQLRGAMESENVASLADAYLTGINANMCTALSTLGELSPHISVEFDARFTGGLSQERDFPTKVILHHGHVRRLKDIALTLRYWDLYEESDDAEDEPQRVATTEPPELMAAEVNVQARAPRTIIGEVVSLVQGGRTARARGSATIYVSQEKKHRFYVELTAEQYRIACDAHRDARRVRVSAAMREEADGWHADIVDEIGYAD